MDWTYFLEKFLVESLFRRATFTWINRFVSLYHLEKTNERIH